MLTRATFSKNPTHGAAERARESRSAELLCACELTSILDCELQRFRLGEHTL